MSDLIDDLEPPAAPAAPLDDLRPSRRWSLVWLVPLLALAVTLGVAWRNYADRGPLIEIMFNSASGVEAGKTPIKHRDVTIGIVEKVGFSADAEHVVVSARMDKEIARFIDRSAKFWVIRPQVTARGVTGLDTVISGAYIEADWDGAAGPAVARFEALAEPPLTPPNRPGMRLRLRADDGGGMIVGAPVFFKRIEVGKIESKALTPEGDAVMFDLFIDAPHHERITEATRFWNASGVAIELGAEGAKLRVESLISLLQGGVSFDELAPGAAKVAPGRVFRLYGSEKEARSSVYEEAPGAQTRFTVAFEGSVRGLKTGAPVEYRGLKVGEVVDIAARTTMEGGAPKVTLVTTLTVQPGRLGVSGDEATPENIYRFMRVAVAKRGLRAKLASASLLTGALYVELVEEPNGPPVALDMDAMPWPQLPSAPSDFEDFTASAEGVMTRINGLPIEDMLFAATELLRNVNALVASEGVRKAPESLNGLLGDARALLADPALTGAPAKLSALLENAQTIASGATDLPAKLTGALDQTAAAAAAIAAAAEGAPALMAQFEGVARKAEALPLEALLTSATQTLNAVNAVAAAEGADRLPASIADAAASLGGALDDLRAAGVAEQLGLAVKRAAEAADAAARAAEGAPELVARMNAIAATAESLPLEALVGAATETAQAARALLVSDGMEGAPVALTDSLRSVDALLADLRKSGAAQALAGALTQTQRAAASIGAAADRAPQTLAELDAVLQKARALPLEDIAAAMQRLINDLDRIASAPGADQTAANAAAALAQLRAILADFQGQNGGARVAGALASADNAAVAFASLAGELSALTPRIAALAQRADATLAGFEIGSEMNYETMTMIREIRDAARAVTALADSVERKPNSLLLGK